LLQDYTVEELYYEYRDKVERERAAEEQAEEATDTIEQKKLDDVQAWADAEEAREAEEAKKAEDEEWMKKQIDEAKADFGEDFGEDIGLDFE
jgi:hypothetical protein